LFGHKICQLIKEKLAFLFQIFYGRLLVESEVIKFLATKQVLLNKPDN